MGNPILEQLNNSHQTGYSLTDLQNLIKQNGGAKEAFYAMANKMGVNPNSVINQVKSMTNQQMQNMVYNNPMIQQLANMLK